jgi:hypothetical protein
MPDAAPAPAPAAKPDAKARYERHRQAMAQRSREQSAKGRALDPIPAVEDPARRAAALACLQTFLLTYFVEVFYLPFSADHQDLVREMQACVEQGGQLAYAMERGSGKTAIAERAAIWAVLTGRHEFVTLVGASGAAAAELMDSIKSELDGNDLLAADFPEVCVPIRELEGKPQRCAGQTYEGQRTHVIWKRDMIVLPMIPGSAAAGVILKVASMTGRIRGMKYTRADGRVARPTFVVVDDFQTEKSAWSIGQCKRRLGTINGTILKLAGPGKKVSCVIPCTVIRKGDAADQILDREKAPQFRGKRCKKLYAFPARMDLWQQYAVKRADDLRAGGRGEVATEFYRANRAAMDEGAQVAWPERFDPDHLSALETAMVLFFEDRASFMAECQNEPEDETASAEDLKPEGLRNRPSGCAAGVVPDWATVLTAGIDVQKTLLYWTVCAFNAADFTGSVVARGTWPSQHGRRYFLLKDAQHTIQEALPRAGLEAQIRKALDDCEDYLLGRTWKRGDGTALSIARLFKDAGYEMKTVFGQAAASKHRAVAMPSRGVPIGPGETPMMLYDVKQGETLKDHVLLTTPRGFSTRWAKVDVNYWKSFVIARARTPVGGSGALTFHETERPDEHDMLFDHLCAERGHVSEAKGRKVVVFELAPGAENHHLDNLVQCYAAAAVEGATLAGQSDRPARRKFKSYDEWKRHKFGNR